MRVIRCILVATLACADCGPEIDPSSVCVGRSGSSGGGAPGIAYIDWIALFDQNGERICRAAEVSVTFGSRTAAARRDGSFSATLRGAHHFDFSMGGDPCNVYSTQLHYPRCTDTPMDISVRVPGCRSLVKRTDWFSLERAARADGVTLGQWLIPIQLTCELAADAGPGTDASTNN